jgi:hypothetical protein
MKLVSSVTAPLRANRLPLIKVAVVDVIEASARKFP